MCLFFQKSQIIWPPESIQRSGLENIRIDRNVFESSFPSKSTSLIPSFAWKNVNTTENTEMFPKEIAFHGKTMNAMALKSSGTIDRSDTLTRWALSHPKCATNVTSYVGQTAKMHCCLARLDRDLSVKNIFMCVYSCNVIFYSQFIQEMKCDILLHVRGESDKGAHFYAHFMNKDKSKSEAY
jgi:hypothetical protein